MTCRRCTELEAQVSDLERDLRAKRALVTRLRNQLDPPDPAVDTHVRDVFEHWRMMCRGGTSTVKLTPKRAARVRARLDDYDIRFILRAIDGAARHPTVVHGRTYDDLELICRDGEHLEDFERRAKRANGATVASKLVGA